MVSFILLISSFELSALIQADPLLITLAFLFSSAQADFFPGHSVAGIQMIEAQHEEWRAEGVQIAADAPWTLSEQILSIQARLRPAHQMLRRL